MQLKKFDIILDIKKNLRNETFEVVQGDMNTNILNITLYDGLQGFVLAGLNVEIAFSKPDGTTVLQDSTNGVTLAGDKIICTLSTNTIAAPGKVLAEVRVLNGADLLTSAKFDFYVRKSLVNDDTIVSTNEFPVLNQLIETTNGLIEQVNQIEKQVPEQVVTDLAEVSTRVGPLASLTTLIKTSIVNAINSLKGEVDEHKADNVSPHPIYAKKTQENWINATLQNGWTGNAQYAKNDLGIVTLSFEVAVGAIALNTVLLNLPFGYRPSKNLPVSSINGSKGTSGISLLLVTSGELLVGASSPHLINGDAIFGNISYYAG